MTENLTPPPFDAGDVVVVFDHVIRKRKLYLERWAGRIIRPSVLGDGWWLVKRGWRIYTVAERDMERRDAE